MPIANRRPGTNFDRNHTRLLAWIPPFLEAMSRGLCVREACRIANTSPSTVYHHRVADEAFRACWDRAVNRGTELLEQEAIRRAYHGVEKPVFYKGEQVGSVTEYSDPLLMFMLRARRPEVYREKDPRAGDTHVHGNLNLQQNVLAAQTIREMIANGELGTTLDGILEGSNQGQQAPALAGPPDDSPHGRQVGAGATLEGDQQDTGGGVAHAEQPDRGDDPIPAR